MQQNKIEALGISMMRMSIALYDVCHLLYGLHLSNYECLKYVP